MAKAGRGWRCRCPRTSAPPSRAICRTTPHSDSRRVFLRQDAPHVGFATSASVFVVANTALKRAGIQGFAHMGAHLFRHSLATALLRSGASLTEIGQVLRHRDRDTMNRFTLCDRGWVAAA
ncbi:tyrosine-type recombinase/integrase [Azospirillum halopraeferens]|uniref:tyrosine-type recombinase/integrase n=1 Tax=Azospirillum halopraeferens TaxID=34010 RepID=UPI000A046DF5|nr:tyrosine-type recombinase/integrase [Azospirillum halopraeferens]